MLRPWAAANYPTTGTVAAAVARASERITAQVPEEDEPSRALSAAASLLKRAGATRAERENLRLSAAGLDRGVQRDTILETFGLDAS